MTRAHVPPPIPLGHESIIAARLTPNEALAGADDRPGRAGDVRRPRSGVGLGQIDAQVSGQGSSASMLPVARTLESSPDFTKLSGVSKD